MAVGLMYSTLGGMSIIFGYSVILVFELCIAIVAFILWVLYLYLSRNRTF